MDLNLKEQLLGKSFPIRDTDTHIVQFKTITDVKSVTSNAAYAISLNNSEEYIIISQSFALQLVDMKYKTKVIFVEDKQ